MCINVCIIFLQKILKFFQFSLDKTRKRNIINLYLIGVCFFTHFWISFLNSYLPSAARAELRVQSPQEDFLSGTKTAYRLFECWIIFFDCGKRNNVCIKPTIKANDADVCAYASGSFYKYNREKYA